MGASKNQPGTIGAGGVISGAGALAQAINGSKLGANTQIAPPAQAGSAVGVVASHPSRTQRAIGNSITKGTQR